MKTTFLRFTFTAAVAAAWLGAFASAPAFAAGDSFSALPTPLADAAPADEIMRTGVIERRVSIGGETTGWSLRDEKGKRIDLLLPIAAFATIRDGAHVVIKGKLGTKKYPERGEVTVFLVREISEIVH